MNTALNIKEIDELLQRINLQHVKLNQLSGNIPIIELDLEMKLVLDLYELLDKLKSMSRQDNVIDKSQVNDQQTIAESATDFESINLIEKEQGGLSEQIDLMAAMEKEETEPYKATLENKRSEIRELLNMVVVQQRNLRRDLEDPWSQADELAVELISDLKKEYHLE